MTNNLLKKIKKTLSEIPIKSEYVWHLQNISILIVSYLFSSLIIYPKFSWTICWREIFAIFCTYAAIFFWFIEDINPDIRGRIMIFITAFISPMIFIKNSLSIAIVEIFFIIIIEYIIFQKIEGCNVFSSKLPIYIVSDAKIPTNILNNLKTKYKILEKIQINKEIKEKQIIFNDLNTLSNISNRLEKLNNLMFFPKPQRILSLINNSSFSLQSELLELSAKFALPIFNINSNDTDITLSSISRSYNFDKEIINDQKNILVSQMKGKHVWIFYDGRQIICDLIQLVSGINTVDLTIMCESENLLLEINQKLNSLKLKHTYKVKLCDVNLITLQNITPDILFYNIPVKSFKSSEDNLKEALAKNILNTKSIIEYANEKKVKFLFLMSSLDSMNARNWIGATQRLGELILQISDAKNKKSNSKSTVIRLPECIEDKNGLYSQIMNSIFSNGKINFNFPESERFNFYSRKEIFNSLCKLIQFLLKDRDFSSNSYSVKPDNNIDCEKIVEDICSGFSLDKNRDIKISYDNNPEMMKLDDFPNISENLEKTEIDGVFSTKFSLGRINNLDLIPSDLETIREIQTRDLIASVFQTINEKTKK